MYRQTQNNLSLSLLSLTPLPTLQRTLGLHCQGFSCAFPFHFVTAECIAISFLLSLMAGWASFSFRQWDAVPASNPATNTQPTRDPCSPLVCFEGDNFFLGVLAALITTSKQNMLLLEKDCHNPAPMYPGAGSTHLHVPHSLGEEVCSAALAQPWTCKAPFRKWMHLLVKWRVTLPSSCSFSYALTSSGFTPCYWIVCTIGVGLQFQ